MEIHSAKVCQDSASIAEFARLDAHKKGPLYPPATRAETLIDGWIRLRKGLAAILKRDRLQAVVVKYLLH
jgi:hypothetical protein